MIQSPAGDAAGFLHLSPRLAKKREEPAPALLGFGLASCQQLSKR